MSPVESAEACPAPAAPAAPAAPSAAERLSREAAQPPIEHEDLCLTKVYVWEWVVRVTHWAIAFSIVVLAATGIYIGHPFLISAGPAGQRFVMGTVKLIHFYTATLFTLAVLSRITWMFMGNRFSHWDKFIPVHEKRYKGLIPTLKFYVFMLRKPPGFIGHNPLAGLTYSFVFLLYLTMISTGLALYSVDAAVGSPFKSFGFLLSIYGGPQAARWIHHVVMWLLIGFAVHHVYSAVLMSQVEQKATVESIFSGYKFVPPEDLVFSGYRFLPRPRSHE
jgi:Ni/Fe-hydrogenase 1 B-type cytochrome subunit